MSFVQSSKRKVYDQPYLYHRMSLNLLLYTRTYIRIRVYAFVKLPTVYLIRGQNNLIIIASRRAAVSNIICPHVCTRVRTCAHTLIGIRLSTAFSFSFSLFFFLFNLSPSNNVASLFLENSLNIETRPFSRRKSLTVDTVDVSFIKRNSADATLLSIRSGKPVS